MKRILFFTYNDAPSGIYEGQVIDVCRFLEKELQCKVTLFALISIRDYSRNKMAITGKFHEAIVKRMFPRTRNWRWNSIALKRVISKVKPDVIIARGPFAANLALEYRGNEKICFDARGAYTAELNEYNVVPDEKVKKEISLLEKTAVRKCDSRIAVSEKLVEYWKKNFGYNDDEHAVIPCTLNNEMQKNNSNEKKTGHGFANGNIVIAYSGSGAGWQSLRQLDEVLQKMFRNNERLCLLMMTKQIPEELQLKKEFPDRVKHIWVEHTEVNALLSSCDYGWLVREKSVTNEVASPVKFAEYLAAGLKVIISPGLGDYSAFTVENNAGILLHENDMKNISAVNMDEKKRMKDLAEKYFTKKNFTEQYKKILR
ncbi:MAG: glycosyltransferase [Bacteroidetes bacterium]|nr:glycosyltransferase [Bacteroidota bacterium]